jgi:hypothetical protein
LRRFGGEGLMDVDEIKRKNIIDMALGFTATIRLFEMKSKKKIAAKLEDLFLRLSHVHTPEDYEVEHRSICDWFTKSIKLAKGGNASYGHAAKILDVTIKVYVYYCALPTPKDAERLIPFLHGAIDTEIMNHIKPRCSRKIEATSLSHVDESAYQVLQAALANDLAQSETPDLHPVEYDDVLWRLLNK